MIKDITNRQDIERLVNTFYDDVRKDELIGNIFNTIIGNDWSHHLPIMYRFWESVLLSKPGYEGNPVKKHIDLDKRVTLQKGHFERWLTLWNKTVDSLFSGEIADLAKHRASLMANLINIKVDMARGGKSLM